VASFPFHALLPQRVWCNCLRIRSILVSFRVHGLDELRRGRSWSMFLWAMGIVWFSANLHLLSASTPFACDATAAASPPMSQVVPLIKDRSLQSLLCTYEQDFVPGSRMCVMHHSTRRRIHCAPQRVGKSKLVVRTRGSDKSDCPNCRLAERCKACRLAR
jgi:hypothetical protein